MQNCKRIFNRIIFLFVIFLSGTSLTWGLTCPKNISVEDIAKMLIEVELSGIRVENMEANPCLKQSNFPYLLVQSDYNNDETSEIQAVISSKNPIKHLSVKLFDKDTLQYRADYSLQTEDKIISDSINFFLYTDLENQKKSGCAGVLKEPDRRAVYQKCRIKLTEASVINDLNIADYKTTKGRYRLYRYYENAVLVLKSSNNKNVLTAVIKSYIKEFSFNPNHFSLEPFLPYYMKNKESVNPAIKMIATEKEARDFFLRLNIALRELKEGNG